MAIAHFPVFSSSPPCLTQEFLCHFWHKSFVTTIFPSSSPASAVPPWNCISESFCGVSFVLSLWDSAYPEKKPPSHMFLSPSCTPSPLMLTAVASSQLCACHLLKDVLSSLFLLSQPRIIIINNKNSAKKTDCSACARLAGAGRGWSLVMSYPAQQGTATKHCFDIHKPCGTKHWLLRGPSQPPAAPNGCQLLPGNVCGEEVFFDVLGAAPAATSGGVPPPARQSCSVVHLKKWENSFASYWVCTPNSWMCVALHVCVVAKRVQLLFSHPL